MAEGALPMRMADCTCQRECTGGETASGRGRSEAEVRKCLVLRHLSWHSEDGGPSGVALGTPVAVRYRPGEGPMKWG